MARDFSAAATDAITTGLTSHATNRTFAFWAYRTGSGGGGFGRVFDKRTAGAQVELLFNDTDGIGPDGLYYQRAWTGGNAAGSIGVPANNEWHQYVVTYDASSASNLPAWYKDGVSQTLVDSSTTSGTLTTNTDAYVIGNRTSTANRNWGGYLCEFAVWDRILTTDEIAALGKGYSPYFFGQSLVLYTDLVRNAYDRKNNSAFTISGTSVVNHPRIIYPTNYQSRMVPVVASGILIKTLDGLAQASIKTYQGLASASTKTFNGLSNV